MLEGELLKAVEGSDKVAALNLLSKQQYGDDPWALHLALYPVAQMVLNPPFINPHWPKVYTICRELAPYLFGNAEITALLRVVVNEYAQRPKFEEITFISSSVGNVGFGDIEGAIADRDRQAAAQLMYRFIESEGREEFARRMLLLGSGYLSNTLGHSVSCTAFILLEMMEHELAKVWPTVACLSDYFCKGEFTRTPPLDAAGGRGYEEAFRANLLTACSGKGIVNLHHTLTAYALTRTERFFSVEEKSHLSGAWINFMGDKDERPLEVPTQAAVAPNSCEECYETFSDLDEEQTAQMAVGMLDSPEDRGRLGRYLIKGVIAKYKGDYDPHYLTALGSTLWLISDHWERKDIVYNGLHQYLGHLFRGLRRIRDGG